MPGVSVPASADIFQGYRTSKRMKPGCWMWAIKGQPLKVIPASGS